MKKMLVSDFDDTLYVDNKIDEKVIRLIHEFRKKGNVFAISTGSSLTSFYSKSKDYDLEYDYLMVNHGSTIYKNEEVLCNEPLDKIVLLDIINRYNLMDEKNYILEDYKIGNFFSTATNGLVKPTSNDITKVHLQFDEGIFEKEKAFIEEQYGAVANVYTLRHNDLEVISKKASKLIAIRKIKSIEKVDDCFIYTIGDDKSDIEMIMGYNGYVMENCADELDLLNVSKVSSVGELLKMIND